MQVKYQRKNTLHTDVQINKQWISLYIDLVLGTAASRLFCQRFRLCSVIRKSLLDLCCSAAGPPHNVVDELHDLISLADA